MSEYFFTQGAFKEFKKLTPPIQRRILEKMDYYSLQENCLRFADKLIDFRIGSYRFRIGDYRVVFDLEDEKIKILTIGHRREIYR